MSEYLHILIDLKKKHQRERNPNFPEYARATPKYSDKKANGLTNCIIDFIIFNGGQAERISNAGRYIDQSKIVTDILGHQKKIGTGKWIPGQGTNGTADISSTILVLMNGKKVGLSVKIEVKIGNDKQSAAQKRYQADVESSGGRYMIARSFDDFYVKYIQLINEFL